MYLKIMSHENKADDNCSKEFKLIECHSVDFYRADDGQPFVNVEGTTPNSHWSGMPLTGNAYILNDRGRTIDSFAFSRLGDASFQ